MLIKQVFTMISIFLRGGDRVFILCLPVDMTETKQKYPLKIFPLIIHNINTEGYLIMIFIDLFLLLCIFAHTSNTDEVSILMYGYGYF